MHPISSAVAALLLGLIAGPAWADAVPNLDVEKTCRSAQVANTSISDKANYDGCLRSERDAKKEAERHWGRLHPGGEAAVRGSVQGRWLSRPTSRW